MILNYHLPTYSWVWSCFGLIFFGEVLHFYSQLEGRESHNTTQTLTFPWSCNTEQHSVALKIYS